nr:reverse transcriptase domain-containing protein [Tanacetum cinerariifolium]
KLGDPGKFLIPCEFPGMDECLALADLGASTNLMPFSVWEALSLPELTPTCMTLELADRSVTKPIGIAKDVSFKVGVFHFLADFVVVDFEPDLRVPLILGRCFLKTSRPLIDVHKGELTLHIEKEAITYNLDQTVSGNPTTYDDPIISTTSPTLTTFGDSDFLLFEEADAFLGLEDDPDLPKINPFYYDPEGDILLLETILNSKPLPPLPNHEQYLPSYKKELKVDVFVPVGKFTFPADFVIVDYESDPRVPLILGRPFLRTARALINVHGEEMILHDGDERLTLNIRLDTSSYSNQPQKESINLINFINNSSEDFLEDLFPTN